MEPLGENCLLKLSAVIRDKVTSTDELIPSGDTASYRSNPIRLADYTYAAAYRDLPEFAERFRLMKRGVWKGIRRSI